MVGRQLVPQHAHLCCRCGYEEPHEDDKNLMQKQENKTHFEQH